MFQEERVNGIYDVTWELIHADFKYPFLKCFKNKVQAIGFTVILIGELLGQGHCHHVAAWDAECISLMVTEVNRM